MSLGALWSLVMVAAGFAYVLLLLPALIWAERKGAAMVQDRPGPNRAHVGGIRVAGMVHTIADVVKLVTKEDVVPAHVDRRWWALAPVIGMSVALAVTVVIPWADSLQVGGHVLHLQAARIDAGALFILSLTSLSVYGTILAGWASGNKFAMLGGLRASAQMLSYELAMGLVVVAIFLQHGSLSLHDIVAAQAGSPLRWGVFTGWGLIGFPAFLLLFVAVFAETNRVPFDLPEGEAELVAGFHTEYSALRFALFFMGEYAAMIGSSAFTTCLFWGGYQVPFLPTALLRSHADQVLVGVGVLGAMVFAGAAVWAWRRRNTRFRKALLPTDPRLREVPFWIGTWSLAGVVCLGLAGLGAAGLAGRWEPLAQGVAALAQLGAFTAKILFGCWCFIWVRWTLPRFRYDQLMDLGWRRMLPLAFGLVVASGLWVAMGR